MSLGLLASESNQELRKQGARLLAAHHAALQALKLYPLENDTVQRTIDELHATATRLLTQEGRLELRLAHGCFFLNQVRIQFEVSSYIVFDAMEKLFGRFGIGALEIQSDVERAEWVAYLLSMVRPPTGESQFASLSQRLQESSAHIRVLDQSQGPSEAERNEAAKRVYARSVQVSRDILTSVRVGQAVNVRKVKRSVQNIVDQVMTNQTALLGMTTLRDFDEYTFTHSVNVCILCVVFGHKLGLERGELYELGLCGLLHDLGKMRLDSAIINKPGALDDGEWATMRQHPTLGLLSLFKIHGFADAPFRQMLAAYEHHMKVDFSGYPKVLRPRQPTLFTRIVSVVDTFDAVTSKRSYRSRPWPPDVVLKNMRDEPDWGLDPILVKAFINTIGIYPIGTVVVLSDHSLAVVTATNAEQPFAPMVRVLADSQGTILMAQQNLDLAVPGPDAPRRILKAVDAKRYQLDVGRFFA